MKEACSLIWTALIGLFRTRPGGMRELHWHPNTNEWQYYIEG
jgi:oxalate decarboxylase